MFRQLFQYINLDNNIQKKMFYNLPSSNNYIQCGIKGYKSATVFKDIKKLRIAHGMLACFTNFTSTIAYNT